MLDILDIPEVRQRVSRLSVSEYHQLGEFNDNRRRTELIRGIVIEKMPKSSVHGFLTAQLMDMLASQLPPGMSIRKEDPLTLRDSEPEPDLAVVSGTWHDYRNDKPATARLVVGVAVSNPALDRENAALYAEAGVAEYWIVLGNEKRVEVYRQPHNGAYQEKTVWSRDQQISSAALPEVKIRLSDLFE